MILSYLYHFDFLLNHIMLRLFIIFFIMLTLKKLDSMFKMISIQSIWMARNLMVSSTFFIIEAMWIVNVKYLLSLNFYII